MDHTHIKWLYFVTILSDPHKHLCGSLNTTLWNKGVKMQSSEKLVKNWVLTINNPYFKATSFLSLDESSDEYKEKTYNDMVQTIDELQELTHFYDLPSDLQFLSELQEDYTSELQEYDFLHYELPYTNDQQFYDYCKGLKHITYFIFQQEVGTFGTAHLQVYLNFSISKRFSTIKALFPTAHIEPMLGTKTQARQYCSKENSRRVACNLQQCQVYEYGEFVPERSRTDLKGLIEVLQSGADNGAIIDKYPLEYFKFHNHIETFRTTLLAEKYKKAWRTLEVTYIYGKTGVGKTRNIMETYGYENVFRVTDYQRAKFDAYKGQDVVILEEFRSGNGGFTISDMLNLLDGYPLMLPARFNDKVACFTKVFILTNWPLYMQFENIQKEHPDTFAAFLRRIHKVYDFNISKEKPISKEIAMQKPMEATPLTKEEQQKVEEIFG